MLALGAQARAQNLTTIFRFDGLDGASPVFTPAANIDGTLYGTTGYGGGAGDCGTIYALTPGVARHFATLHTFSDAAGCPAAGATYDPGTNTLYGTTGEGGSANSGTIFAYSLTTGLFATAASLVPPPGKEFLFPSGLTLGSDGALYGTEGEIQGKNCTPLYLCSYVFKFDPGTGLVTRLHILTEKEGGQTAGNLVFGQGGEASGKLYGVTLLGGPARGSNPDGFGTVYQTDPVTGATHVIHLFTESLTPVGLTADDAGNLYVTTQYGGDRGSGEIIKLAPNPAVPNTVIASTIFEFGSATAGGYPMAPLTYDSVKQVLYGTTSAGGAGSGGDGVLFQINPDGSNFTVLHAFAGGSDGANPNAAILVSQGQLFGATLGTVMGTGHLRYCNGPCGTLFAYPRF